MNPKYKLKKEDELLLICAQTKLKPEIEEKIISLTNNDLNWEYLIHKATINRLKPLLYFQLRKIAPINVPDYIMDELKKYFTNNAQNNLLMLGELLKVLKVFESNGITAVPYKGPILAIEAYDNVSLRDFDDLDIYIPMGDVLKAKKILISNLYKSEFDLEPEKERIFIKTQRELKFSREDNAVTIEMHWAFKSVFFSLPDDYKIWSREKSILNEINGIQIIQPSKEDMLLILSIHNASHRWSRISWICDIKELVESADIDWCKVQDKAKHLRVEKVLLINLALAENLLDLEIPDKLRKEYDKYKIQKFIDLIEKRLLDNKHTSYSLLEEVSYSFNLRDSFFYGIKDVLKGLMNPTIYEWKNIPLPTYLIPLYLLLRPIFLLKRHKLYIFV